MGRSQKKTCAISFICLNLSPCLMQVTPFFVEIFNRMTITIIAGARPNFMKIAPIIHAIQKAQTEGNDIAYRLVHTGQHYDQKMSETFFEELNIPQPDINLGCGGGTQAEQTAHIMIEFEKELMTNPCDLVLVVGDVTSTMACSIVASLRLRRRQGRRRPPCRGGRDAGADHDQPQHHGDWKRTRRVERRAEGALQSAG